MLVSESVSVLVAESVFVMLVASDPVSDRVSASESVVK